MQLQKLFICGQLSLNSQLIILLYIKLGGKNPPNLKNFNN